MPMLPWDWGKKGFKAMTDYQRACEVVGCYTMKGPAHFTYSAIRWLVDRDCSPEIYKLEGVYFVNNCDCHTGPTLTAALTAAVLAVAGETKDGH